MWDGQWGVERHKWDHMTCAGLCWGCGVPSRSHTDTDQIQKCLENWGNISKWPPETLNIKHFSKLGQEDIEAVKKMAGPDVFNGRKCRSCELPLYMVFDPETRDVVWDHRGDEDRAHHFLTVNITRGGRV